MQEQGKIEQFFRLYFGNLFSKKGKGIFGIWLKNEHHSLEKEQILKRYWDESEGEITDSTFRDWGKLDAVINSQSAKKRAYTYILKYAAVLVAFILTVGISYRVSEELTLRKSIEMAEIFVPYGETRKLTLSDGTSMWINAGTTVVYPKDFEKMDSRSIYLTGQASFSVAKDKEKPFIVRTAHLEVQALGTEFTVKAYPNEDFTKASLEQGSVKVSLRDRTEAYILTPGEQIQYSQINNSIILKRFDINSCEKIRQGYLVFTDASIVEIFQTLERKYGVIFQYNMLNNHQGLYNVKFSPDDSIEEVMEILHYLWNVNYIIKDKCVIIR